MKVLLFIFCLLSSWALANNKACSVDCLLEPSTFVHGCVSTTTGAFIYSGPSSVLTESLPLTIPYVYNPIGLRIDLLQAHGFALLPPTNLHVSRLIPNHKKRHDASYMAVLSLESGGFISLNCPPKHTTLSLGQENYNAGITNVFSHLLGAKSNMSNVHIEVLEHGHLEATKVKVTYGDGREVLYEKDRLIKETLPCGNEIHYHYDSAGLAKITTIVIDIFLEN